MLFNGEHVGTAAAPRATSPSTRSTARRSPPPAAKRDLDDRRRPTAAPCSTRRRVLHGQDRRGAAGSARRHPESDRREPAGARRGEGQGCLRAPRRRARPAAPRAAHRRHPRGRRRHPPDARRRRRRRHQRGPYERRIDMCVGIGGSPEGVATARAIKALGGVIQGRLAPRDDEERARASAGLEFDHVYEADELVAATTPSSSRPASPTANSSRRAPQGPDHPDRERRAALPSGTSAASRRSPRLEVARRSRPLT